MKKTIDRRKALKEAAKVADNTDDAAEAGDVSALASDATPSPEPWLGSSVATRLDDNALDMLSLLMTPTFRREMARGAELNASVLTDTFR